MNAILNAQQTADYLEITIGLAARLAREGKLKGSYKEGRDWRIPRASVEAYKLTRKVGRPKRSG